MALARPRKRPWKGRTESPPDRRAIAAQLSPWTTNGTQTGAASRPVAVLPAVLSFRAGPSFLDPEVQSMVQDCLPLVAAVSTNLQRSRGPNRAELRLLGLATVGFRHRRKWQRG